MTKHTQRGHTAPSRPKMPATCLTPAAATPHFAMPPTAPRLQKNPRPSSYVQKYPRRRPHHATPITPPNKRTDPEHTAQNTLRRAARNSAQISLPAAPIRRARLNIPASPLPTKPPHCRNMPRHAILPRAERLPRGSGMSRTSAKPARAPEHPSSPTIPGTARPDSSKNPLPASAPKTGPAVIPGQHLTAFRRRAAPKPTLREHAIIALGCRQRTPSPHQPGHPPAHRLTGSNNLSHNRPLPSCKEEPDARYLQTHQPACQNAYACRAQTRMFPTRPAQFTALQAIHAGSDPQPPKVLPLAGPGPLCHRFLVGHASARHRCAAKLRQSSSSLPIAPGLRDAPQTNIQIRPHGTTRRNAPDTQDCTPPLPASLPSAKAPRKTSEPTFTNRPAKHMVTKPHHQQPRSPFASRLRPGLKPLSTEARHSEARPAALSINHTEPGRHAPSRTDPTPRRAFRTEPLPPCAGAIATRPEGQPTAQDAKTNPPPTARPNSC